MTDTAETEPNRYEVRQAEQRDEAMRLVSDERLHEVERLLATREWEKEYSQESYETYTEGISDIEMDRFKFALYDDADRHFFREASPRDKLSSGGNPIFPNLDGCENHWEAYASEAYGYAAYEYPKFLSDDLYDDYFNEWRSRALNVAERLEGELINGLFELAGSDFGFGEAIEDFVEGLLATRGEVDEAHKSLLVTRDFDFVGVMKEWLLKTLTEMSKAEHISHGTLGEAATALAAFPRKCEMRLLTDRCGKAAFYGSSVCYLHHNR